MIHVDITVSGPGECINFEMLLIQQVLEQAGISVTVVNDFPVKPNEERQIYTTDDYINHQKKLILDGTIPTTATLTADHLPWGG